MATLIASGFACAISLLALGRVMFTSDSCSKVVETIKKMSSRNTTSISGVIFNSSSSGDFGRKFIEYFPRPHLHEKDCHEKHIRFLVILA